MSRVDAIRIWDHLWNLPDMAQPHQSFILCTSPRSGSTLLCRMLAGTGQCGQPDSYFHAPSLKAWLEDYDLAGHRYATRPEALRAVFDAAIAEGCGGTGCFGLRIQQHSFAFFLEQLALLFPTPAQVSERIEAAFGPTRYVWLARRDKLAQAVSYVKAQQSGLWHKAPDGTELERLSPPRRPVFDRDAITRQIAAFEQADAAWAAWFEAVGVDPLCISYDALAAAPRAVLAEVLTFLGKDPALAAKAEIPVARLADQQSRDWARRFLAGRE